MLPIPNNQTFIFEEFHVQNYNLFFDMPTHLNTYGVQKLAECFSHFKVKSNAFSFFIIATALTYVKLNYTVREFLYPKYTKMFHTSLQSNSQKFDDIYGSMYG